MHTTLTSRSHSRVGSYVSQEQNNIAMQLEIDHLKEKLRHARRKRTTSNFDVSSDDGEDVSYRRRSRTPPSESFSDNKEHRHKRRYKNPSRKGLGNDAMRKTLNQISKSSSRARLKGKTSSVIQSTNVHHLQWSNGSCGACEPFQPENDCPLQERGPIV